MFRYIKKLIKLEQKHYFIFFASFIFSLILSSFIYYIAGSPKFVLLDYTAAINISNYSFITYVFFQNVIYFFIVFFFALYGSVKFIYISFIVKTSIYGLSVIYSINSFTSDKMYLILTLPDSIIYFPILVYFTFISIILCKHIKKGKYVETKYRKFDIIVSSYIRTILLFMLLILIYSILYNYYVEFILEMLVN